MNKVANTPVKSGAVGLTTAAIRQLSTNSSNVTSLLDYTKKSGATVTSAVYSGGAVKLTYTYGGKSSVITVTVNDVTSGLALADSTREGKAKSLEGSSTLPPYKVVLAGSSSVEKWGTSATDMQPNTTLNVGIGGSTVDEWTNSLAQRLILPYSPRAVVLYVGVNDIKNYAEARGNLSDYTIATTTANKVIALCDSLHEAMPYCTVYYVLINQITLAYSNGQGNNYVGQITKANSLIVSAAASRSWLVTVDADKNMVDSDGKGKSAYYTDGIHMTSAGYSLWVAEIKKVFSANESIIYG